MEILKFELPVSKPLFRFGSPVNSESQASGNTAWTVLTVTTTGCVFSTADDHYNSEKNISSDLQLKHPINV